MWGSFLFFCSVGETRSPRSVWKQRGDGVEGGAPNSQTEAIKHRWKFLVGDDLYDSHSERAL